MEPKQRVVEGNYGHNPHRCERLWSIPRTAAISPTSHNPHRCERLWSIILSVLILVMSQSASLRASMEQCTIGRRPLHRHNPHRCERLWSLCGLGGEIGGVTIRIAASVYGALLGGERQRCRVTIRIAASVYGALKMRERYREVTIRIAASVYGAQYEVISGKVESQSASLRASMEHGRPENARADRHNPHRCERLWSPFRASARGRILVAKTGTTTL